MNNLNKKDVEKNVLIEFIKIYKKQIDPYSSFIVLEIEKIKQMFPDYKHENPDFVISFNGEYKGIELFELIGDKPNEYNLKAEEKGKIKNLAHLYSKRDKENNSDLIMMPDMAPVAIYEINKKIKKLY